VPLLTDESLKLIKGTKHFDAKFIEIPALHCFERTDLDLFHYVLNEISRERSFSGWTHVTQLDRFDFPIQPIENFSNYIGGIPGKSFIDFAPDNDFIEIFTSCDGEKFALGNFKVQQPYSSKAAKFVLGKDRNIIKFSLIKTFVYSSAIGWWF